MGIIRLGRDQFCKTGLHGATSERSCGESLPADREVTGRCVGCFCHVLALILPEVQTSDHVHGVQRYSGGDLVGAEDIADERRFQL